MSEEQVNDFVDKFLARPTQANHKALKDALDMYDLNRSEDGAEDSSVIKKARKIAGRSYKYVEEEK